MFNVFKHKPSQAEIDAQVAQILDIAETTEPDIRFWRSVTLAVAAVQASSMANFERIANQMDHVDPSTLTPGMLADADRLMDDLSQKNQMMERYMSTNDIGVLSDSFIAKVIDYLTSSGKGGIASFFSDDINVAREMYRQGFLKRTEILKANGIDV